MTCTENMHNVMITWGLLGMSIVLHELWDDNIIHLHVKTIYFVRLNTAKALDFLYRVEAKHFMMLPKR